MTERERWGLRGPAHSCQVQRTLYLRRCGPDACATEKHSGAAIVEFRADGALAQSSHHNPDGSEWRTAFEYDAAGRKLRARTEKDGQLTHLGIYEYDAAGRLVRVLAGTPGGADRIVETYEYTETGAKKKTFHVDEATQRTGTCAFAVEGTDAAYSAPGAARLVTLYNDRDQPTDLTFHDASGRQLSRVEFRYDEAGRLAEEAQKNSDEALAGMLASMNRAQQEAVRALFGGGEASIGRTHSYDAQGRRSETHSNMGRLFGERKTVTYNDNGDPILEGLGAGRTGISHGRRRSLGGYADAGTRVADGGSLPLRI